jgi:CheY-like chemotaxis protein
MAKILIADDEFLNRDILKAQIEAIGTKGPYEFEEVQNGEDALRVVNIAEDLAVAVLDNDMPIRDGCEVARELKKEQPGLPVVIYTSNAKAYDTLKRENIPVFRKPDDRWGLVKWIDSNIPSSH